MAGGSSSISLPIALELGLTFLNPILRCLRLLTPWARALPDCNLYTKKAISLLAACYRQHSVAYFHSFPPLVPSCPVPWHNSSLSEWEKDKIVCILRLQFNFLAISIDCVAMFLIPLFLWYPLWLNSSICLSASLQRRRQLKTNKPTLFNWLSVSSSSGLLSRLGILATIG